VFLLPKTFILFWFSNILALSVPEEGYYRNMSCTLNFGIYVFITITRSLPLLVDY